MRFFLISAGVFALAIPVLALAVNYVPLAPIPNLDGGEGATLESYINSLFLLIISVGAMLAVIRVVIGGFQYMTQTASTTATSNARQTIRDAVIGLILLLSVYLILSVVNPQILNLSALKFENLAPSDEVKKQIKENREDAARREAERKAAIKNFGTDESTQYCNRLGQKSVGSSVDATNMLSLQERAYNSACRSAGKDVQKNVAVSCKNIATGKIRTSTAFSGTIVGDVPVVGGVLEGIGNVVSGSGSCGKNEVEIENSYQETISCTRPVEGGCAL